jgi:outer membrane protein assembly factor BamB
VQENPIPYYPGHSLPDEYWTRPINAQFYEWVPITGNWLRSAGGYTMPPIPKYHPNNEDAPETAHILWTKQYAQGGLTGDVLGNVQYEMGDAYEGKFSGSVIIDGVLYYNRYSTGGSDVEQEVVAVNLKTGEELWAENWGNQTLAFGQVYYFSSFNYHGAFAYLWTTEGSTWHAHDPLNGRWVYSMTNVPSGWNLYGENGEIYRYTVDLQNGWVTLWNSSKVVMYDRTGAFSGSWLWGREGTTFDAMNGIEWNVTIPTDLPGSVCMYFLHDKIFGSTSGGLTGSVAEETITSWAISVKPDEEGTMVFNKSWKVPESDLSLVWTDASADDGVFIISGKENRKYYCFSLDTGDFLWETEPEQYLSIYDKWYGPAYGYGRFYTVRMSGIVTCYNITTGEKLWEYPVKDEYAEITWGNNWPIRFDFIADGKIYLSYAEHSPINPMGRGAPFVCLNATSGEEIWSLSWMGNWWGGHTIIGDNIMAGMNAYDNRMYAIGKGPSATTVTAAPKVIRKRTSVVVEGSVTDISPGTSEYALTARFPNGVPALADENMSEWMQYVYMQYERPEDVAGVTVKLEAIDSSGQRSFLGTTITNMDGEYGFTWTPDTEGQYEVIATFEGTKSYWGSHDTTFISVDPELSTEMPAYLTIDLVILIVAVIGLIIGLIVYITLRK